MLSQNLEISQTPLSNTGSKPRNGYAVHVHWLQGMLAFGAIADLHVILGVITRITGDEIPWDDAFPFTCGKRWENSVRSVHGIMLAWNNLKPGQVGEALLSLPGSYFDRLQTLTNAWDVCTFLKECGFRSTRFDANIDDYDRKLKYELVLDAAENSNFAYFRKKPHLHRDLESGGWCFTFGYPSKGQNAPDKQLVIYDKAPESDGEIDAIRIEARYRDERSQEVFERFCSIPVDFTKDSLGIEAYEQMLSSLLASIVCGSISFVDKTSGAWASRCKMLDWWQDFTDSIAFGDAMKIPSNRPEPTCDRRIRWMFKISAAYETLMQILGDDAWKFVQELSDAGKKKMTASHEAFVNVSKREFPKYRMGVYWCNNSR